MVKKSVKGKIGDPPALPTKRTCGTMPVHHRLLREVESYAKNRARIENLNRMFARRFRVSARDVIKIPVVVHVVWNTAEQNIADAQIKSQIDVLNKDFRKKNPDASQVPSVWESLVADARIEFFLATKDPQGKPTTGVTRTKTSVASFTDNDRVKSKATGGSDAWPADCYLNIWVCNLQPWLGYAQFPGGPPETDGVVITYTAFGTTGTAAPPFNLGRTATHEIGHWLDLRHIWGDDDGGCGGTDFVDDTPNQGSQNYGCPDFPHISCENGPNGDMFMNYMDYVDDGCMYVFTAGQVTRIDACLEGPRSSLLHTCIGEDTGKIKGKVVYKSTGNPVEDVMVSTDTVQSVMTKSDGTYELSGVPIGKRVITAIKAGYKEAKTNVTVKKDKVVTANFELEEVPPVNITGKVANKSTKEPVEGAKISADTGQSAVTKSDGTYELISLPLGNRVITATKAGCKCACTFVTVKEGEVAIANFKLDCKGE